MSYQVVVIGGSAGSIKIVKRILNDLETPIKIPIIIVLHQMENASALDQLFNSYTNAKVKEAIDKELIDLNTIYTAPAGYHLQVEPGCIFSLSLDERVNYSRPSIDILFTSAADVYKGQLIGILLTGANIDGAMGLKQIEALGGKVIIQSPETAYMKTMPQAGIDQTKTSKSLSVDEIISYLNEINGQELNNG